MKKIILTIILVLAAASSGISWTAGHTIITGKELEAMMKNAPPLVIVDVREPELYSKAHIPGAINIPYEEAEGRVLKELNPKDTIVFVCHGGPMGDELAGILVEAGYRKVYNLKGGMRWWKGPLE